MHSISTKNIFVFLKFGQTLMKNSYAAVYNGVWLESNRQIISTGADWTHSIMLLFVTIIIIQPLH